MHWSNKLLKRGNLPALRYGNLPLRKALARATGKRERRCRWLGVGDAC